MSTKMQPQLTRRDLLISQLAKGQTYDIAIVGGGATGLGVALDAAARGLSVVLGLGVVACTWAWFKLKP